MPIYGPVISRSALRYESQLAAQGYYAENFHRNADSSTVIMTTQRAYYMSIGLDAGDVVTNICVECLTAGTGSTGIGMKVGLYSKAGIQLVVSGDVSATLASAGAKALLLSAPYTVLTSDGYFIALLWVGGTPPVLYRQGAGVGGAAISGNQLAYGSVDTQTDLPAPATIANNSNSTAYWVGVN